MVDMHPFYQISRDQTESRENMTLRSSQRPKKKTEILIIGAIPPPFGGVTIHIARLSQHLRSQRIDISILDEGKFVKSGVARLRAMSPVGYFRTLSSAQTVHIHSSNHVMRLIHTVCARLLGRRVVHTVHSARGSRLELTSLYLASHLAHERIGVSSEVTERLAARSHVIPAFVPPSGDEEVIASDIETWMRDQKKQRRKIIAFNAYLPSKIDGVDLYGLDMLIDALSDERMVHYSAILCISLTETADRYYDEIQHRVLSRDLGDRVRFQTGQVSFAGILKRADIFVRPTITDGDAISIREAIWYGVPAIASDAVTRPEGSIIFRSRDIQAFVDAILTAPGSGSYERGRSFADEVIRILVPTLTS